MFLFSLKLGLASTRKYSRQGWDFQGKSINCTTVSHKVIIQNPCLCLLRFPPPKPKKIQEEIFHHKRNAGSFAMTITLSGFFRNLEHQFFFPAIKGFVCTSSFIFLTYSAAFPQVTLYLNRGFGIFWFYNPTRCWPIIYVRPQLLGGVYYCHILTSSFDFCPLNINHVSYESMQK